MHGWNRLWDRAKDLEIQLFEEMHYCLSTNLPTSTRYGLVHNDLKFDNVMFDPEDPSRVTAILDWDMTTLGDPLMDLGTLLCYWAQPGDPGIRGATNSVTAQPGFPTRAEITERYAKRRGIEVSELGWYESFGLWKTAVVLQQIYIRFVRGQTQDDRFAFMGGRIPELIELSAIVAGLR